MQRGKVGRVKFDILETQLFQENVLNKRRITLKKLLFNYIGLMLTREQPDLFIEDIEYAGLSNELQAVCADLGLRASELPLQATKVEIEVNGVAIALDDEVKFTPSRLQTLSSSIYTLPLICNLNRYKIYCQQALPDAESQLTAPGALKQRGRIRKVPEPTLREKLQALDDFMQDLLPLVHYVPVLRISIHDQLETPEGTLSIHSLLAEENNRNFEILADYLIKQLDDLEQSFHLEF